MNRLIKKASKKQDNKNRLKNRKIADKKQIEKEKITEMFSGFGGIKNARNYIKSKNKF